MFKKTKFHSVKHEDNLYFIVMKYEVLRGQTKVGSYDFDELKALYQAGVLLPSDFFWIPGMPDWKPLSSLLAIVPPLPAVQSVRAVGPSSAEIMATSRSGSFAYSAWMVAAFIAPYLFSWRIIFDRTLGYSKGWKIFYALWIPIVLAITSGGGRTRSSQPENLESKNAAFMATLTPEQRIAVETMQRNFRQAARENAGTGAYAGPRANFDHQDENKDGRLDMKEFMSQPLYGISSYSAEDFDSRDTNKDGYVTFEELSQR